jgi:hypothetical protein
MQYKWFIFIAVSALFGFAVHDLFFLLFSLHSLANHATSKAQTEFGCSSQARSQVQLLFQDLCCVRHESKTCQRDRACSFLNDLHIQFGMLFNFSLQFLLDSFSRSLVFFKLIHSLTSRMFKSENGFWLLVPSTFPKSNFCFKTSVVLAMNQKRECAPNAIAIEFSHNALHIHFWNAVVQFVIAVSA